MSPVPKKSDYATDLRLAKSLLIVTELQNRKDLAARQLIENYTEPLEFRPLENLLIEEQAWEHVRSLEIKPQLVFCHPLLLQKRPSTSLYYRAMAGLSLKAAKEYFGPVEAIESGDADHVEEEKAIKMACTYNFFISSIIVNSTRWSLENGHRTILATMGITLDGTMRNKVGEIAEERIRRMIVEWLVTRGLIVDPLTAEDAVEKKLPRKLVLKNSILMSFSSEPDIAFERDGELIATVEIKGGIDPAGALERYGAAKKSFEHAVRRSGRCRNFYLCGVVTEEVERRIREDRMVEKTYGIIQLLNDAKTREEFLNELFHHTLRVL
jgi:hypothetical protein